MSVTESIFFAYESGHLENLDSIRTGISEFNRHQNSYIATTWQDLDVTGKILNRSVLKAISDCKVFACDMSYLNHNVLFEFGYAIGKQKELLVLLNPNVENAKNNYQNSKYLNNIGYFPYENGKDVLKGLQQHKFEHEMSVTSIIESRKSDINTFDLLYLESPTKTQASLDIKSYLNNEKGKIIINDTTEVGYQTLTWYVTSLVRAKSVIVHLVGSDSRNRDIFNAEYSFYAGVAAGLRKQVILIAPKPFRAPIDYSDILIEYISSHDCIARVAGWYEEKLEKKQNNLSPLNKSDNIEDKKRNLLQLGIGYEMAEEEDNLLKYFIEIETYKNATRRNTSIVTGRKGSGKTAIFLKLRNDFESDNANSFTVVLKPESDELLEDIEMAKLYSTVTSKQSFLTSIWRYVILSRLLISISDRILESPAFDSFSESIEKKIVQFCSENKNYLQDGHFMFIGRLFKNLDELKGFGNQHALEGLYNKYIGPIQKLLKEYFKHRKFTDINILADNLDKTWDAENGLDLQSDMILSLLSYNDRLTTELQNDTVHPHTVVFLRTDIFEYVLDRAREGDKLIAKRLVVDWQNFPEKLKELIEERFIFSLNLTKGKSVEYVWSEYFRFNTRKHPFDFLKELLVPRPRDYIFLLSKMFESSVNRNSSHLENRDLEYGLDAYNNFLYRNMIAETRARFPQIINILKEVQRASNTGSLDYKDFLGILIKVNMSENKISEFIRFLYDKDYGYAFNSKSGKVIQDFESFDRIKDEKRFLLFSKHRLSFQIQPNKNRILSKPISKEILVGI